MHSCLHYRKSVINVAHTKFFRPTNFTKHGLPSLCPVFFKGEILLWKPRETLFSEFLHKVYRLYFNLLKKRYWSSTRISDESKA